MEKGALWETAQGGKDDELSRQQNSISKGLEAHAEYDMSLANRNLNEA